MDFNDSSISITFTRLKSWLSLHRAELSLASWVTMGFIMIIFNKALLSIWNFKFPFFLTAWHCFIASLTTQLLSRTTDLMPGVTEGKVSLEIFITKFVPISVCFAGGLALGNSAYQYLSVAYIQMLKSFTPVPLLLVGYLLGKERPSIISIAIVITICSGLALSTRGELNFSIDGFVLQCLAMLCDVCRINLLDILVSTVKLDSLSTLYYYAPCSFALITLGFFTFEYQHFSFQSFSASFWCLLFLNGLVALLLNLSSILALKLTSAMTIGFAGLFKDALIILSSFVVFGSPLTLVQLAGYCISLAGIQVYKGHKSDPEYFSKMLVNFKEISLSSKCHYCRFWPNSKVAIRSSQTNPRMGSTSMQEGADESEMSLMEYCGDESSRSHSKPGASLEDDVIEV